jgi:hypothetical protein
LKIPKLATSTWISVACAAAAAVIAILLIVEDKPWDIIAKNGPPEKVKHLVAVYEWCAGAFNILVLLALAATARWWCRASEAGNRRSEIVNWLPSVATPRWFWPLVVLAMAITAWCGLQRINFSVWDDEDTSLRTYMVGKYRDNAKGEREYRKADWQEAFWNYKLPTNHHFQTILSKVSHSLWSKFGPASPRHFLEPVLRWHLLMAAVLSVAVLALLIKSLGLPRVAVVAAFLLALHPWHIRYAVELRGYMYTMLLGPLMVLCLLQAISTGRWRWWLGFAFSQFALLYAYPGTIFMLVAANVCGLAALWLRHTPSGRLIHMPRMLVASVLSGMVWVQLMAPNIPQLAAYFETSRAKGTLSERWHLNAASHFVSGLPWNNSDNGSLGYPELRWITGDNPTVTILIFGIAGLLLLIGLCRLATIRPAGWLLIAILLFPALLVYASAWKNENYLYEWYLIFALPGLCVCVALALDTIVAPLRRLPWGHVAAGALLAVAVGGYAIFSQPARHWLVTHPLQPIKDVVLLIRPSLDPKDPRQGDIITAALNVHLESYDPHVLGVDDLANLKTIAHRADAEDKPLFVVTGNDHAFSVDNPELRNFLRDSRYFEAFQEIKGFDPSLSQKIWLYRSGSLVGVP